MNECLLQFFLLPSSQQLQTLSIQNDANLQKTIQPVDKLFIRWSASADFFLPLHLLIIAAAASFWTDFSCFSAATTGTKLYLSSEPVSFCFLSVF